ncbi:hypothetical protein BTHE68_56500 [Burkholderia sp. THE68]|nr:hypothetical protein BTHE68_56500 [Burkholderia sp. THE68]
MTAGGLSAIFVKPPGLPSVPQRTQAQGHQRALGGRPTGGIRKDPTNHGMAFHLADDTCLQGL